jgi:ribosomal protein L7Ae-like RNA K-turn-binding protein
LQQFQKREGHCNVPQSHIEDKANLGTWVNKQRQLKANEQLDPDRQKQLEDIGFEWVFFSAKWDETHALLQQFKKREGHCNVPQSHTEDEANLGKWVSHQRELKAKEQLDPDRTQRLEDIGFKWEVLSASWDEMYALLQQYKKREGHCNIPQSHTEDEANLGTWVNTQRQLERKEKLDPDRRKLLDDLGFNWAIKSTLKDLSSSGEVGIQV